MSINQYSSELPEAHCYHHHRHRERHHYTAMDSSSSSPAHKPLNWLTPRQLYASAAGPMFCPQNTGPAAIYSFNLNAASNEDDDDSIDDRENNYNAIESGEIEIPKQLLFEKPLTPSDVGKLNRLVIPKQHAEKCFPLNGGGESGENGLLLNFEDELGKSWRFRYSYWNSSQSYVLTKGWSRFVKEKQLDAGDIVVFSRHRTDAGRLFIGWKRRNSIGGLDHANLAHTSAAVANGGGWNRMPYSGNPYRNHHQLGQSNSNLPQHLQPDHCPNAGSVVQNQTGNSKRLRLFGVNLECQAAAEDSEPATPVGSPMSGQSQHNHYSYQHHYYSSITHMDTTFSGGDTYRQG